MFGKDKIRNAIHCSDLPEDGLIEVSAILFRFPQVDMHAYPDRAVKSDQLDSFCCVFGQNAVLYFHSTSLHPGEQTSTVAICNGNLRKC